MKLSIFISAGVILGKADDKEVAVGQVIAYNVSLQPFMTVTHFQSYKSPFPLFV